MGRDWYDFWTGETFKGGQTVNAAAPLETMPLYVRAGSIVPMGPELQYTSEKPLIPSNSGYIGVRTECLCSMKMMARPTITRRRSHASIPAQVDRCVGDLDHRDQGRHVFGNASGTHLQHRPGGKRTRGWRETRWACRPSGEVQRQGGFSSRHERTVGGRSRVLHSTTASCKPVCTLPRCERWPAHIRGFR